MASMSTHPPPLKTELEPTSPQPSMEIKLINQEPPSSPPLTPQFVNSLSELRSLSIALSAFLRRYDELHGHLDFIKTSIDSKLPNPLPEDTTNSALIPLPVAGNPMNTALIPLSEPSSSTATKPSVPVKIVPGQSPNKTTKSNCEIDNQKPNRSFSTATDTSVAGKIVPDQNPDSSAKSNCEIENQSPNRTELENLCEKMSSRDVRRYLITHLSDSNKLRDEVPKALKLAKDPATLILQCIGRFFLQGSRAYKKGSPMIPGREASVLAIECFLLMESDFEIPNEVEEEAATAAEGWRKRLVSEGGLAKAEEIDARGLLLLISGFGIPAGFEIEDIRDLIMASNAKGIAAALRRSIVLIPRLPEIIEGMVKNKMEIEAVDIAYTFGLEDRCPPRTILTPFLRKIIKSKAQGSSMEALEKNKKQLAQLKSVMKCLEVHKIDPSKLFPESKLNETILSLEKEIAELDKKAGEKTTPKRKAVKTESSDKPKTQEVKRSRFTGNNLPYQQKAAANPDPRSSYNGLNSFLDGPPANYIQAYLPSSSLLHGSRLPEHVTGSIASGAGSDLPVSGTPTNSYVRLYSEMGIASAPGAGSGLSVSGMPTNSYARLYGESAMDTVGQMVNQTNKLSYGWHGDAALTERLVGQTYAPQPSSAGVTSLYRSSASSMEPFAGLPNHSTSVGVTARGSTSDLYRFADVISESESHSGSDSRAASGSMHTALPGGSMHPAYHHSSYLY